MDRWAHVSERVTACERESASAYLDEQFELREEFGHVWVDLFEVGLRENTGKPKKKTKQILISMIKNGRNESAEEMPSWENSIKPNKQFWKPIETT